MIALGKKEPANKISDLVQIGSVSMRRNQSFIVFFRHLVRDSFKNIDGIKREPLRRRIFARSVRKSWI